MSVSVCLAFGAVSVHLVYLRLRCSLLRCISFPLRAVVEALEVQDELPFAATALGSVDPPLGVPSASLLPNSNAALNREQQLAALRQAEAEAIEGGGCLYSTMIEDLFFVFQASVSRALRCCCCC